MAQVSVGPRRADKDVDVSPAWPHEATKAALVRTEANRESDPRWVHGQQSQLSLSPSHIVWACRSTHRNRNRNWSRPGSRHGRRRSLCRRRSRHGRRRNWSRRGRLINHEVEYRCGTEYLIVSALRRRPLNRSGRPYCGALCRPHRRHRQLLSGGGAQLGPGCLGRDLTSWKTGGLAGAATIGARSRVVDRALATTVNHIGHINFTPFGRLGKLIATGQALSPRGPEQPCAQRALRHHRRRCIGIASHPTVQGRRRAARINAPWNERTGKHRQYRRHDA